MNPALETILHDLHALALLAREAGISITWYEPNELRSLGPEQVEDVMTFAANEFIECSAPLPEQQLLFDIEADVPVGDPPGRLQPGIVNVLPRP